MGTRPTLYPRAEQPHGCHCPSPVLDLERNVCRWCTLPILGPPIPLAEGDEPSAVIPEPPPY
jgi:hypothetical protein